MVFVNEMEMLGFIPNTFHHVLCFSEKLISQFYSTFNSVVIENLAQIALHKWV